MIYLSDNIFAFVYVCNNSAPGKAIPELNLLQEAEGA